MFKDSCYVVGCANGNLYLDVDPSASSKLKLPIEAGPDANPLIATIKLRTDI